MASKTKIERALESARNSKAAMQRRMKERKGAAVRGASAVGSGYLLGAAEQKWGADRVSLFGVGAVPALALGAGVGSLLTKNRTAQNVLEGIAAGAGAIGAYKVGKGESLSPRRREESRVQGLPEGAPQYVQPRRITGPRRPRRRDSLEDLIESLEERIEGGELVGSYEEELDAAE